MLIIAPGQVAKYGYLFDFCNMKVCCVFSLKSHEIFFAHILTIMSGKNSILGLSEPTKNEKFYMFILMSIYYFMLN